MRVNVVGHGALKKYSKEVFRPGLSSKVKSILDELGIDTQVQKSVIILKNDQLASLTEELQDGDKLELFVLLSGG